MNYAGYRLATDLPDALRPWRDRPVTWANVSPLTGTYHLDSSGVYLYYPDGGSDGFDHPVGQCQFGLGCIASYRVETDPARKSLFLERARAQADRLISQHTEAHGSWWFPYGFDFTHAVHSGVSYTAPWYSGMAQGEAVSLFVQLSELEALTADERAEYLAAAGHAFASLQHQDDGYPWVVNTDPDGYLWIQEYPGADPGTGDYTFNGMIFALLGIFDYYCATGDPAAAAMYDAGATTIAAKWPRLRNPRWYAYYCDTHRIPATTYQQHHIRLLEQMARHTASPDFFDDAERLVDDCPAPAVSGTVQFEAGSFTLYRFDTAASGAWVEAKGDAELARQTVTFSQATQAPASVRRRIQGRGIYYLISSGAYTGWWVGENWQAVYLLGAYLPTVYQPARTITFPGGSTPVEVCKIAADGTVTARRTASFASPSNAPASQRAVVNGRPQFLIAAGAYTGYWVPASAVTIDTEPAVG